MVARNINKLARTKLSQAVVAALGACASVSHANPMAPTVVHGTASISTQGKALTVTNSPGAIINWRSFSINAGEVTRFIQQSASSQVLNRVTGVDPSVIAGALQSNGRVYLINPNGIAFGPGAQVNVSGLVASTLNLSNENFLAGKLKLDAQPGAGKISNAGAINVDRGGQVIIVAPQIENSGIIRAPDGDILLAAGRSANLVDLKNPEISVEIHAPADRVLNVGHLVAKNVSLYGALVENSGTITATSAVVGENGRVSLRAKKDVTTTAASRISADGPSGGNIIIQAETGAALVAGTVSAVALEAIGGSVQILGNQVAVLDQTRIDVSGEAGGGKALVGGGISNKIVSAEPPVQVAQAAYVAPTARIDASAKARGNGGTVVIRSEGPTRVHGTIVAQGGSRSGSGGFVETSGKGFLLVRRPPDLRAPRGRGGTWLVGGGDIDLVDGNVISSHDGLTFSPVAGTSTVALDGLTGSSFLLNAEGTIIVSGSINLAADGSVESTGAAHTNRIVLNAQKDIVVERGASISANGAEGGNIRIQSGGMSLVAGDVSAVGSEALGGRIEILGRLVALTDSASVNASGATRGGTLLIGGDFQGRNPDVMNAWRTYVGPAATLRADAIISGNGGRVIVWADDLTGYYGSISARGGARSGDGGFVEVSGKGNLIFEGRVDLSAPRGAFGSLLLDPLNIMVADGGTATPADVSTFGAQSGTTQTIAPATLNAVAGNVTLQATNDIDFNNPVTLTAAGASLTAQAGGDIRVNAGANITTNNGQINLSAGNAGGTVDPAAALAINAGLTSAGANITLTNTQSGGITMGGTGNVNAGGATLSLSAPNDTLLAGATISNSVVTALSAGKLAVQGSATLTGVTLATDATIQNGGVVTVNGGLTLRDSAKLTLDGFGGSTALEFNGTQTLAHTGSGTGEVVFSANNFSPSAKLLRATSGTLTVGPGVLIHGVGGTVGTAPGALINQGVIRADVAGGTLVVTGVNNTTGTLEATAGGILDLAGAFTFAQLGGLRNTGGTINLTGTLDNTGSTLVLDATTGSVTLAGGTIQGGTISTAGGASLLAAGFTNSTLNGVTLAGEATIQNGNVVTVNGGLTLRDSAKLTLDGFGGSTALEFNGTQTLAHTGSGTGEVVFSANNFSPSAKLLRATSGTLTVGPGVLIHGVGGTVGTAPGALINQGVIRADVAGGTLVVTGVNNTTGTLEATAGGILDLAGAFTFAQLGGLRNTGGTINLTGTLDNTGSTLVLDATTGSVTLAGGTIQGGTISTAGGASLLAAGFTNSTLNGVTLAGEATIQNGNVVTVNGGLTLRDSAKLTLDGFGGSTALEFNGTQTLAHTGSGTGEVVFSANNFSPSAKLLRATSGTLTVGPGVLIHGVGGTVGTAPGALINQGVIRADVAGGTLVVTGVNNTTGTLEATAGGILDLAGAFTFAQLGGLRNTGGTINLTGTLDNTGSTLVLDATTGSVTLAGGTIQGGTISTAGGASLLAAGFTNSTLNGVTLAGEATIQNGNVVTVNGGLTLRDSAKLTLDGFGGSTALEFNGTQTLAHTGSGTGEVVFSANNFSPSAKLLRATSGTLTVGPGVLIHGVGGTVGTAPGALINQGVIRADVAGGTLIVTGVNNTTGTLEATAGGILDLAGAFTFAQLGGLRNTGGTINLTGTLDNTGSTLVLDATTGSVTLAGGTIQGGTISTAGGASLVVAANSTNSTLTGVTLAGEATIQTGAVVTVNGGLTLRDSAKLTLDSFGAFTALEFNGTQTLAHTGSGTGEVVFSANSFNPGAKLLRATSGTLTVGPGVLMHGVGGTVGDAPGALINQGAIRADVTGGRLVVTGVNNTTGTLEATAGGILDLAGAFTFAQLGGLRNTGGTINLTGTLDNTGSTLALDATTGSVTLAGGTIQGGTISTAGGASLVVAANSTNSTLTGVTLAGEATIQTGAVVTVNGGLTLRDSAKLTLDSFGAFTALEFNGTQTLAHTGSGTGEVVFSANSFNPGAKLLRATSGTLTVGPGVLMHGVGGTVGGAPGALINQGAIRADVTGGRLVVTGVNNTTGTLEATAGGILDLAGASTNSGTLRASDGGTLTVSNLPINAGLIEVTGGSTFSTGNNPLTNNGTIQGSGTIDLGAGVALTNNGIIRAGTSPGTLNINGDLVLSSSSVTQVEVQSPGTTAGTDYDVINVTGQVRGAPGDVNNWGMLTVTHLGGFAPPDDSAFSILTYASRQGDFSTQNFPGGFTYTTQPNATTYVLLVGATGATNTWILASGGAWDVDGNWSLGHVPTAAETALIPDVGTAGISDTITVSAAQQARRVTSSENLSISGGDLTLGTGGSSIAGTVTVSGGALAANGPLTANALAITAGTATFQGATAVAGALNLSGGTLAGSGALTVSGVTTLSGGTMTGTGSTITQGALNITGSIGLDGGRTLDVRGGGTWSAGQINLNAGSDAGSGTIVNRAGSALTTDFDSFMFTQSFGGADDGSTALFSNAGTFTKSAGTGATTIANNFTNTGTLQVQAATLTLAGGSTHTGGSIQGAGTIDFGSGTHALNAASSITAANALVSSGTVGMAGTYNVSGATTVAGGSLDVAGTLTSLGSTLNVSAGTLNVNASAATLGSLNLAGGTLAGSGALTVSGVTTLSGGTMTGTGSTITQGALNITGSIGLDGGRTLDVRGGGTWSAGQINLNAGSDAGSGTIVNRAGSALTTDFDSFMFTQSFGGADDGSTALFSNAGTFTKSAGTGATTIANNFTNTGTLQVQAATLTLAGGSTHTGGSIQGAGTIDFGSGTHALNAASSITAANALVSSGAVSMAGTYNVSGTTSVNGGSLDVAGTLTSLGSTLNVSAGTLNVNASAASVGSLNLSGGTLAGSGALTVSGVTTLSGGTMTGTGSTITQGALNITGSIGLDGGRTLDVRGGGTWSAGQINLNAGSDAGSGTIVNRAGSALTTDFDSFMFTQSFGGADDGSTALFSNAGTFTKSAGTGATTIANNFTNTGTLQVQAATLTLAGGSTHTGGSIQGAGTIDFGSGTHALNAASSITAANALVSSGTVGMAGTYNVSGATTVAGGSLDVAGTLTSLGSTLNVSAGTLNVNASAASVGSLNLSGGTLAGSGALTVSGVTTLSGGTMTGTGSTITQGALNITGSIGLDGGRTLDVRGGGTWSAGQINLNAGSDAGSGTIVNRAGSALTTDFDSFMFTQSFGGADDGSTALFSNAGTFTKSAGTGATTIANNFTNTGTLQVQAATLTLAGGSTHTGGSIQGAGTIDFGSGTHALNAASSITAANALVSSGAVSMAGTYNVSGTTSVNGGSLDVAGTLTSLGSTLNVSAGTLNVNASAASVGSLNLSGGTLAGSGALTVSGVTTLSGGTMTGTGSTITQGALNITGSIGLDGGRTLDVRGGGTWSAGQINLNAGSDAGSGTIVNRAGSALTTDFDSFMFTQSFGGADDGSTALFSNAGTFTKSAGTGATTIANNFTNTGTVQVQTGTLSVSSFPTNSGTIEIAAGAALSTSGFALNNMGSIGGAGTLDLGVATLTNNGIVRPGAATGDTTGTLSIIGDFAQGASGRLDVELGGTAAGDFDVLAVSGLATLGGTLGLAHVGGFAPTIGNGFTILSYASGSGDFAAIDAPIGFSYTGATNPAAYFLSNGAASSTNTWALTGGGLWEIASNWSLGHVPTAGEDAVIPDVGAAGVSDTITVSAAGQNARRVSSAENLLITSGELTLGTGASSIAGTVTVSSGALTANGALTAAALAITGGTATFNSATSIAAALNLSGGILAGSGALTVGGLTTLSGGTMTGAGSTITQGALNINGNLALDGGRTLDVRGGGTWSAGVINLNAGIDPGSGTIANRAGSALTTNFDGVMFTQSFGGSDDGSTALFSNGGTFTKSAGTGITAIQNSHTNSGTLRVQAGTLSLTSGGSQTGSIDVSAGATLGFDGGTHALSNASAVSSAGTLRVSAGAVDATGTLSVGGALRLEGGRLNAGGAIDAASYTQTGGTLASAGTLTVSGATTLSGGTMTGAGSTITQGALNINGNLALDGGRTLDVRGGGTWSAGVINLNAGTDSGSGTIINRAGSALTTNFDGVMFTQSFGGSDDGSTALFSNAGTFTKAAGTALTAIQNSFTNSGTLEVQAGTIALSSGGVQTGIINVSAGATLGFDGGTHALSNAPAVSAAGTLRVSAGVVDATGTLSVGGALRLEGGRLNAGGAIDAASYTQTGGTLASAGTLTVSGATTLSGGTMTGAGSTITQGALNINGNLALDGGRTLDVRGGGNWSAGVINLNAGTDPGAGTIINRAGSALTTNFDGVMFTQSFGGSDDGSTALFSNAGTFTKAAGTALTAIQNSFTNSGTLEVQAGTIALSSGGVQTGIINVSAGATLGFDGGTHALSNAPAVSAAGTLRVSAGAVDATGTLSVGGALRLEGGRLNAGGAIDAASYTQTGGTLASAGTLTVSGATTLSGGTMTGAGSTITQGALNINGNLALDGGRTLDVRGGGTWSAGVINLNAGTDSGSGTIINRAGSALTTNFDGVMFTQSFGGSDDGSTALFSNAGTFTKAAGTALTAIQNSFTNSGTLEMQAGTIAFSSFPTNSGTIEIAAGAALSTTGLGLTNAGTIGGAGTLDLGVATLTNNGIVRPGAATGDTTGTLSITGGFAQSASGRLDIELGGTAAGDFDVLAVSGAATLGGTLNLAHVGGFAPTIGNGFTILSYASGSGDFAAIDAPIGFTYTGATNPAGYLLSNGPASSTNTWALSGGGLWEIASNWSLGHVPTAGEDAVIPDVGAAGVSDTITVSAAGQIARRVSSAENLFITSGDLTLGPGSSSVNAALSLSAGTLIANGPLTATVLNLSGGTLTGTGSLTVSSAFSQSGGAIAMTGAASITQAAGLLAVTGAISASAVTLTSAGGITAAGLINANNGTITLNNTGGASDVTLSSSMQATNSTLAAASPAISVTSARDILIGNADLTASTSGAIRMQAARDITYDQGGAVFNTLTAAGNVSLTATAGAIQRGSTSVANNRVLEITGANVALNAGTRLSTLGSVRATAGTVDLTAGTILDASAFSTSADSGSITLTAAGGMIAGGLSAANGTITLNNTGATSDVALQGSTQATNTALAATAPAISVTSARDILIGNADLTASTSGAIRMQAARDITYDQGGAVFNTLTAAGNVTLTATAGAIQRGSTSVANNRVLEITGANVALDAGTRLSTLGSVRATAGTVDLTAGTNLDASAFSTSTDSGSITLTAAGGMVAGGLSAANGTITLNNTGATSDVALQGSTQATNTALAATAPAISVTSARDILIGNADLAASTSGAIRMQAARDITYDQGGAVFNALTAAGNVSLTATAGAIQRGSTSVANNRVLEISGANVALNAGTSISRLGTVSTPGNVTLNAGTGIGVSGDPLTLGTVGGLVSAGTTAAAGDIHIQGSGGLSVAGLSTAAASTQTVGLLTTSGDIVLSGTLDTNDNISLTSASGILFAGGTAVGANSLALAGAGSAQFNAGTVTLDAPMSATLPVSVGGATVNLNAAATLPSLDISSGTVNVNAGPLQVSGSVTSSGTLNVKGNGTAPSLSVGGSLALSSTSVVGVDLAGTPSGQFGQIAVIGNAALGGALSVTQSGGFVPSSGDSFPILSYGSRTGDFATRTFPSGFPYSATPNTTNYVLALGGTTNIWMSASGLWENPGNWSLGHVPTAAEDAVIPDVAAPGASHTITVSAGALTARRVTSAENLRIASGDLTLGAGASSISGTLTVSGGTLTANGTLSANTVAISSGTAAFNGATSVAGALNLSGGALSGTGAVTVAGLTTVSGSALITGAGSLITQGALNIVGNTELDAGRLLDVRGGATWSAGSINLNSTVFAPAAGSGTIMNRAGSSFTNSFNGVVSASNAGAGDDGASALFGNAGTFIKSTATGTTAINVPLANSGTLQVQSGTLALSSFPVNAGVIEVAAGAALSTNGAALTNAGTIGGGGTLNLSSATLNNEGIVRPGGASGDTTGTLAVTGSFVQSASGRLNLELGGSGAGDFDVLAVSGPATLGGTLNVSHAGAFAPGPGNTFSVLTYASRAGDFTSMIVPSGFSYAAAPGATAYPLSVTSVTNTWTAGSGLWEIAGNWSLGHVPTSAEDALIPDVGAGGVSNTITVSAAAQRARRVTASENLLIASGDLALGSAGSSVAGTLAVSGGTLVSDGPLTAGGVAVSTGTALFNGATTVAGALSLSGGVLGGTGNITVTGATALSGGTLTGAGSLITQGALALTGSVGLDAGRMLEVRGGGSWSAGTVQLNATSAAGSGRITNRAGSVLTNTFDGTMSAQSFGSGDDGGTALFTNEGTFIKSSGTGVTAILNPFINVGTVQAQAGTLSLSSFPVNAGVIEIADGAVLSAADTSLLNQGTIGGAGTLDLAGATLTNNGILRPGAASGDTTGTLTIVGSLAQGAGGGIVRLELEGNAAGAFDVLETSGSATLGGTLDIRHVAGFTPASGRTYPVLSFASATGDFTTTSVPAGFTYQAAVSPASLGISGAAVPGVNTWIGTSGPWEIAGNWSLGHVPTASEEALIPDVGNSGVSDTITVSAAAQLARKVSAFENLLVSSGSLTLGPEASTTDAALTIAGGALTANGSLAARTLLLSGGVLNGSGNLSVTNAFAQTGGAILIGGTASITQASGNLIIGGPISAANVTLNALAGSIGTSAGGVISTAGLLTTRSTTGTALNGANQVGSLNAANALSGGIQLTQVAGSLLTITGMSQTGGNVVITADDIDITGAISAGTASVALRPTTLSRNVSIQNTSGANTLSLTPTELGRVGASVLELGRADGTGFVSVTANLADSDVNAGTLRLVSGGDISITGFIGAGGSEFNKDLDARAGNDLAVADSTLLFANGRGVTLIADSDGSGAGDLSLINSSGSPRTLVAGTSAANSGTLTLAGRDITIGGGDGYTAVLRGTGTQSITAARNLLLQAGNAASASASALAPEGAQDVSAAGISLFAATSGTNNSAELIAGAGQTINAGAGGITLSTPGGGSGNSARIVQQGATRDQTISITGGGSIDLTSGAGAGSDAIILNSGPRQSITLAGGGAVNLRAGSGTNAIADIGNAGAAATAQTINFTDGGTINITGGALGAGNAAGIFAVTGNQTIAGNPDITLTGGAAGGGPAGGNLAFIALEGGSGVQTINARNVSLTGGLGGTGGAALIDTNFSGTSFASANVTATGSVTLAGGAGADAVAAIGSLNGPANIIVNASGPITLTGGSGIGSLASIGARGAFSANLSINSQAGVALNAGAGPGFGGAEIGSTSGGGSVTVTAGSGGNGSLALNGGRVLSLGTVTLDAPAPGGRITQSADGSIRAGMLVARSGSDVTLPGVNQVDTLSVASNGGDISFNNTGPLVLPADGISTGAGTQAVTITTTGGASDIAFGGLTLTGDNLSMTSGRSVLFSGTLAGSGALTLTNAPLTVVSAGAEVSGVDMTAPGILLQGRLDVRNGTVRAGTIAIPAGRELSLSSARLDSASVLDLDGTLSIGSGSSLSGMGALNVGSAGRLDISASSFEVTGPFDGAGTVRLLNGSAITMSGGGALGGSFVLDAGTSLNLRRGGYSIAAPGVAFEGSGDVALSGATFSGTGTARNSAHLQVAVSSTLPALINSGSVLIDDSVLSAGSYVQTAGSTRLVSATQTAGINAGVRIDGGSLSGNGLINGNLFVGAAMVAPGASPGALTIAGDLVLSPDSVILIEIAGPRAELDYDVLAVGGAASLNGLLNTSVLDGYSPAGVPHRFLTYGTSSGAFSAISAPAGLNVSFGPTGVNLLFPALPPPVTVESPVYQVLQADLNSQARTATVAVEAALTPATAAVQFVRTEESILIEKTEPATGSSKRTECR